MKTVHKYIFSGAQYLLAGGVGSHTFEIPRSATILTIQVQDNTICLWAEVETTNEEETRTFNVFGTGIEIPEDMGVERVYIATVQVGFYIWHIYEQLN